jgi:2-hydroxycyclohexanecarboxyl-CoA dehydrogenase
MQRFTGKVVVVTGGGGGIGSGICARFVEEGASVAVCDLNLEACERVVTAAKGPGVAKAYKLDALSFEKTQAVFDQITKDLGPISVLVNTVGGHKALLFEESTPEYWRKEIDINFVSTLNTCRAVVPAMKAAGYGRIINTGSDGCRIGVVKASIYDAAKAAVQSFTKVLAKELATSGVTVNVISPGSVATELANKVAQEKADAMGITFEQYKQQIYAMIPMGSEGTPEDIAGAVAFLASDDAAYVTGQVLSVNGGMVMVD